MKEQELVFKSKSDCTCKHTDTYRLVVDSEGPKLFVNNFLAGKGKEKVQKLLMDIKYILEEEDFLKAWEVVYSER